MSARYFRVNSWVPFDVCEEFGISKYNFPTRKRRSATVSRDFKTLDEVETFVNTVYDDGHIDRLRGILILVKDPSSAQPPAENGLRDFFEKGQPRRRDRRDRDDVW